MLDIKRIVDDRANVERGLLKRMKKEDLDLDTMINLYNQKKELQKTFEELRTQQKSFNDQMSKVAKGSDEFMKLVTDLKALSEKAKIAEQGTKEVDDKLYEMMIKLPNIPDEDIVAGEKEANAVIYTHGVAPTFDFEIQDHLDIAESLDLVDMKRASKMAGASFAMYTGMGAVLEWALINYFIKAHLADGYRMILPPHLLNEESGIGAGQLPKFREDVYWTEDGSFLLPTAETALSNIYRDEILSEEQLPIKLFGYTPCYRREAGGYRTNERGLIRTHQFNKVEMFMYTTHEQSDACLEELVGKAKKLVEGLGLHYQVTKLAAGDCSAGAAKTFDIEVWMPYLKRFQEVSSCSNVKEYQARRANVKYKTTDGENKYVHMLNASGLATSRLMVALLETYQNADGSLTVPDVLREFVGADRIEVAK